MTLRKQTRRDAMTDRLVTDFLAGRVDRRQLLVRAAALGLTVPALSAAIAVRRTGAQEAATPAVELGNYDGRTLRMSLALAESERQVFQDTILPKFNEMTGGEVEIITIEAEDVVRTLEAQVSSGNIEIDLLNMDNNSLAPLVSGGLVEELPEAQDVIPAETIPALLDVLQFDGTYYFLPARPNVQITYYNSRQFEDWGLEPPRTWDELKAAGQTIQENAGIGKLSIQAVPGGALGVTCTQFIWQAGGDPLKIDTPEAAQAYQFMQDLKPYLTPQYPTATFDTTNTYILNESVVLAQNWPFGVNVIVQEGGKEEVLTYEGWEGPAGNALVLGGDVFGVVKGSENRGMALDFAKFFMSKEVQETLTAQLGWPAIREDAFGSVEEWQQPYFETISQALTHVKPRPNVTYWLQVEQVLSDAFNDIVTNGQNVEETLAEYQQRIDEAAAEAGA